MRAHSTLIGIDLDGTLEDSRDDMVSAARVVRAQLDLPQRPDAELRPWVNAGMDQLYRACFDDYLAAGGTAAEPQRYAVVREAYEAEYLANVAVATRLYEGIVPALQELSQLGVLACITNKPEHISRKLLDELDIGPLFSTVVGGDTCAEAKPHPMMLTAALERVAAKLETKDLRVFMIGDTAGDMQLARSFGAHGIWCAWGYVTELKEPPPLSARHPSELARIIADAG